MLRKILRPAAFAVVLLCVAMFAPVSAHATDLSVTAGSVAWVSGPAPQAVVAGATVTAGQPVYFDTTTNTYKLAKSSVAGAWPPVGISLSGASANGYFLLAKNGTVYNTGATIVKNTVYYVSGANAGGIAPLADITTGWETCFAIVATSTTNALIICQDVGIAN